MNAMAKRKDFKTALTDYLTDILKKQNEILKKCEDNLKRNGYVLFMRDCAYKACKAERLKHFAQSEIDNLNYDFKGVENTPERFITLYKKDIKIIEGWLLSGKAWSYNTNPMVNHTELWERETYPQQINYYKSLIAICKQYIN